MKVTTSKSKNAESFYISKSFINAKGGLCPKIDSIIEKQNILTK